jgi:hypothetical protein
MQALIFRVVIFMLNNWAAGQFQQQVLFTGKFGSAWKY